MLKTLFNSAAFALCGLVGLGSIVTAGTIEGSASYRERIALPPGAVLEVKLVDVSLADAPAITMSSKLLSLQSVPQTFSLEFDDTLIEENMRYNVEASVRLDGRLLFRNTQAYPVLTLGNGNSVEIIMNKTTTPADENPASLVGTEWQAFELGGRMLTTDIKPTLIFVNKNTAGFYAGCNRFSGQIEMTANNKLSFPGPMAGTMMACPPPYDELERNFAELLGQVSGYVMNGQNLTLTNSAGVAVIRLAPSES